MDQPIAEKILAEIAGLRTRIQDLNISQESRRTAELLNARLAAIVESSDDAIVSKTLDGIVTTWNLGAERIFGYSSEEMVGRSIQTIVPQDRAEEEPQILAKLRRGERVDHFQTVRVAKDGRRIEVSVTISPIRDVEGTIVGASKIARDITRQKQIEEELKQAKDRAEKANTEKDQFLAVLSHELRTPLMPVLAGLAILEKSAELSDNAETIKTMRRNIELETQLIEDLLDHTRVTRGKIQVKRELSDIHQLIQSVVAVCGPEISAKHLEIVLHFDAHAHFVLVDPKRIQQVLWNLLKNAIKFTSKDGRIEIRTHTQPRQNDNGGSAFDIADQWLVVEVQDNGIGIGHEMIERIFDPFEQGSLNITRRFGGLGLGLSISKSFVELHQGKLFAASEGRGRGSTFSVWLPGAMEMGIPVAKDTPESAGAGADPLRGLRILLVEDHADTRRMLTRLLRDRGFRVEHAGTVTEARAWLDKSTFDVLVSDIGLPDGSGLDVMAHVRSHLGEEGRPIKAIAVSGFGTLEDERASKQAGFRMHLAKPLDVEKLEAAIRSVGIEK